MRSIKEAIKTTPTTAMGALMGIEPLHRMLKTGAAKVWFRIWSTTVRKHKEKIITIHYKLAAVGTSDILLGSMTPRLFSTRVIEWAPSPRKIGSKNAQHYHLGTTGSPPTYTEVSMALSTRDPWKPDQFLPSRNHCLYPLRSQHL